ncbi:MAG: entericidin A/B family lipoprotein [Paracoccaceae bacterium]
MKKLGVFTALMLALAGCNTIEGFGRDVSAGARAVDRAF